MYIKKALYIALLSIFSVGCAKHQVPIAKRNQLMMLSKTEEIKMGKKNFDGMIKKLKKSNNKEKIEMLNRVGERLASNISHLKINFDFVLVENDSVNASCLPNGKVIVNSGVFNIAKTDDQLATILAHEIAHVLSRHGSARISRNKVLNTLGGTGAIIAGLINPFIIVPFLMVYQSGTKNTIINSSIRNEENEADVIGLHLMNKSKYDLTQAIVFWKNLKKHNVHKKHSTSSTHATYDVRIKNIESTINKINKINKSKLITEKV